MAVLIPVFFLLVIVTTIAVPLWLLLKLIRFLMRTNQRFHRDPSPDVVVPSDFVPQRTFPLEADLMNSFPGGRRGLASTLIALGVLGDALIFRSTLGFGMSVWLLLTLAVAYRGMQRGTETWDRHRAIPLLASCVFAVLTSWRAAQPLQTMSMAIAFGSLALAAWPRAQGSLSDATAGDYLRVLRDDLLIGASLPIRTIRFFLRSNDPIRGNSRSNAAVVRGFMFAMPPLVLFATLLSRAEPAFARLLESIFNLGAIAAFLFHSGASAWIASAAIVPFVLREVYVRASRARRDPDRIEVNLEAMPEHEPGAEEFRPSMVFGITEANVLLGTIGALFLAYILVKAQTLFGDHAQILAKAHLSAAEYARTGFFELTAVAALAMVLLLVCGTTVSGAQEAGRRLYRILAGVVIGGVLLITLSAFQRMALYTDLHGLTRMRIYVFFALSGLALSFLWLAFTLFMEQPRRFAFGALLLIYATALGLEVVNVDALVANSNLSRQVAARSAAVDDSTFLATLDTAAFHDLGSDAVPSLVSGIERLPAERRELFTGLMVDPLRDPEKNWRSWTWGRDCAQRASARLPHAAPRPQPPVTVPIPDEAASMDSTSQSPTRNLRNESMEKAMRGR